MTQLELLSALTSLGNMTPLKFMFDLDIVEAQLKPYLDKWQQYNPNKPHINRKGLSLTSLDGALASDTDLTSLKEYAEKNNTSLSENLFNKKTILYEDLRILHPLLNSYFPDLGRTHLIRLDAGGFFPPHRDGQSLRPDSFRVFVPLVNCQRGKLNFILENKIYDLEAGRAYFLNTRVEHALFSFVDYSVHMVLNVPLTEKTVETTLELLSAR